MNILELNNVNKNYGERCIIKNLSLKIPQKSIVAITGKSGSGKSTILNMIGLLENIDSGTIKLNGKDMPRINTSKATKIRRNRINYLFQSYALISDMSVSDKLLMAMEFVSISKKEKMNKIEEVLKELDIQHLKSSKVNTLSGGEQQRVAIARCILKPGDLILADEQTGSLDPEMTKVVFKMIQKLRDKYGKTVIIVTHDMFLADKTDFIFNLS